jgi:hypothetical protein
MKVISTYRCEICQATYPTEGEAIKCEGRHVRDVIIEKVIFTECDAYPSRIHIKWTGGPVRNPAGAIYELKEYTS